MIRFSNFLRFVLASLMVSSAACAEQVMVRHVEYSNDTITDAARLVACIVTVAVVAPPDPRVLNFQFLQLQGRIGWKITGGIMDWKNHSAVAKRVEGGNFSGSAFIHPDAFQKSLTPEGQLVGVLVQADLSRSFSQAFFGSPYSVSVRWQGAGDEVVYYIEQSPAPTVVSAFRDCVASLS